MNNSDRGPVSLNNVRLFNNAKQTRTESCYLTMATYSHFLRTICFVLVIISSIPSARSDMSNKLLIRKCCPLGEQISGNLSCIPIEESNSSGNATQDTVENLRRTYLDFPPWMDTNVILYNSSNFSERVTSFLAHQPGNLVVEYAENIPCDKQHLKFFNTKSNQTRLFTNGTLVLPLDSSSDTDSESVYFTPGEFCTDQVAPDVFLYLMCPCDKVLCIQKCCNLRQVLELDEKRKSIAGECVASEHSWSPRIFHPNDTNTTVAVSYMRLWPVFPACGSGYSAIYANKKKPPFHKFWIFPNGSILVESVGNGVPFGKEEYCGDFSLNEDGDVVENIYVCHKITAIEAATTTGVLYGTLHLVGALFLLLTLICYAVLPDLRSTYQGKAFMCHAASLLVGSLFIVWSQIQRRVSAGICYTTAFGVQFSFLAAFFWLNALCIDASLRLRKTFVPSSLVTSHRKFIYFSLYAWGCPAVISLVTAVLDFTEGLPDSLLRPDFGRRKCWFESAAATYAYFYGPTGVLLLINTVLFVFTIYNIAAQQRDSSVLRESATYNSRKQKFILHLRLFCLMGVTWIMELVSFAVGKEDSYWYFTDSINMLRGLIIFVLFCCKPKVLRRVLERLQRKEGEPGTHRGPTSGSHSTNQSSLQPSLLSVTPTTQRALTNASAMSEHSVESAHL